MTRRIASPDTEADRQLRLCLDEHPTRSFVMIAGAGSGKTTSLVKALAHLEQTKGKFLRKRGMQIACITFTQVAVEEIRGDVGNATLFHVSTIHSFLWTLVHSFQEDIREWVASRIADRIAEAEEHTNRPRTRSTTRARLAEDISRYRTQLAQLPRVRKFNYGTGSSYGEGLLGHDDILRIGPALIEMYPLLQTIVAQRFPYIFVDESQDTNPEVVTALKTVAANADPGFCVGFFGDPMQKIYLAGAGPISLEHNWNEITKAENFRCSLSVLSVINAIRREDDGLQQIAAERLDLEGPIPASTGNAKLFIVSAGQDRTAKLAEVRQWMATNTADPLWMDDSAESNVRFLVLVHRIAARRLGFADVYAALNDNGSSSLKDGLLEGTAWVLRPFLEYLLPLVEAQNAGEDFAVMAALRSKCPLLTKERLVGANVSEVLARLQEALTTLVGMFQQDSTATIGEILRFVQTSEMARLDDRYRAFLKEAELTTASELEGLQEDDESDDRAIVAFLAVLGVQLWGYQTYIKDQSPFSTHQGVKGAEFERVLVVLDDEESAYRQFSYGKYWGIETLSASDSAHIRAHEDSIIDRTRRLFYVCCSRARKDLAVVFYVPNAERAQAIAAAKSIFPVNDIHVL